MGTAYIYMECPLTGTTVTLGKLSITNGTGTFIYSPTAVAEGFWVPDPIRFPLSNNRYMIHKNGGVPGFIDDAMPDGWGNDS